MVTQPFQEAENGIVKADTRGKLAAANKQHVSCPIESETLYLSTW
jgi:hypothetical protein